MPDAVAAAPSIGAIVLADGEVPPRRLLDDAWPGWADGLGLVFAADGGARHAEALGLRVDTWVGDGDSFGAAQVDGLEAAGARIHRVAAEKDETDTELALGLALDAGAMRIAVLGALGGPRLDHGLANVALLASPRLARLDAVMYDGHAARISLLAAPDAAGAPVERRLIGRDGDLVSLLPMAEAAHGVTTTDLRYPLRGEDLALGPARGVSNVRTGPVARVRLESGRLLVIETPVTVRP